MIRLQCHKVNTGLGGVGAPYLKPAGFAPHAGTVYVVNGVGSDPTNRVRASPPHPVTVVNYRANVAGGLVLETEGRVLTASFLASNGLVRDTFRIEKRVGYSRPTAQCSK